MKKAVLKKAIVLAVLSSTLVIAAQQATNTPQYTPTPDEATEIQLALENVRIASIKAQAACRLTPEQKAVQVQLDDYKKIGDAIGKAHHEWPASVAFDENSSQFIDKAPAKEAAKK